MFGQRKYELSKMHIVDIFQGDEYRIHFSKIWHQNEVIKSTLKRQGLDLKPTEGWHPRRQAEWIAGRQLIYNNIDEPISQLLLSSTGKPYYENSKNFFSISHSGDLIGIGISHHEIGIDIQIRSDTIKRTKLTISFFC